LIEVGKLAGNAIVPYSQTTKRTKAVDASIFYTSGLNGNAFGNSYMQVYADSTGKYFADFTINGNLTSTTSNVTLVLNLGGQTFNGTTAITFHEGSGGRIGSAQATSASQNVTATTHDSGQAWDQIFLTGTAVPLSGKPTWADANMEASTNAAIYIPPASATKDGIVNTSAQEFVGLKDFTEGVDVTAVDGSFYSTGSWTFTPHANDANITGTPTGSNSTYIKIGKLVHLFVDISLFPTTIGTEVRLWFNIPFTPSSGIYPIGGNGAFFSGTGADRAANCVLLLGTSATTIGGFYIRGSDVKVTTEHVIKLCFVYEASA
jgi:hypothetical protein